jgi:hypothetical protein
MASILWVDSLGKRYGMLPSEVIGRANTFDLYVMDAALAFENYHHKKSMNNGRDPVPDYTTDELLKMVAKQEDQTNG